MKKIMYKTLALIMLFVAVFLTSCTEDEESGIAQVGVKMTAATTNNSFSTNGRVENTLNFTEIKIGVTELEIETLEEVMAEEGSNGTDEEEGEIEFEGHFIVDLIAGTSDPDFGLTQLPVGIYEELEIEMKPILEGGHTIYVALEFTPEGAGEPKSVIFTYDGELEFELESEGGFELDGTGINQLLVVFDLDILLHGIELSNAVAGEDGKIYINSHSNREIYLMLKANLAEVLKAGEDDDDDGEFDDDEKDDD